jgi:hypothetical protein
MRELRGGQAIVSDRGAMTFHASRQAASAVAGQIALLSSEPFLVLDVREALEAEGCLAWVDETYDLDRLDLAANGAIRAAIVEVQMLDARSLAALSWLAERSIPTVIISNDLGAADRKDTDIDRFPNIIARFSQPMIVDDMVPGLLAGLRSKGILCSRSRAGR